MVHERKACQRCHREIDAHARLCPFCNFEYRLEREVENRTATVPLGFPQQPPRISHSNQPVPLTARLRQNRLFMFAAGAVLLVAAFAIGAMVNVLGNRGRVARAGEDRQQRPVLAVEPTQNSTVGDLRLVPADSTATVGEAITSAPLSSLDENLPAEAQRTDATALPSTEYSRILADAQRKPDPQSSSVDPRTLPAGLGALKQEPPPPSQKKPEVQKPSAPEIEPPHSQPAASSGNRTRPVPVRQPIPELKGLREGGTLRLRLLVGTDGRVKEVDIVRGLSGATAKVVESIQGWRFKPATLDGEPVEGSFDVEISFNAEP
jgi:TonB family protein